ncbi:MAG TPA: tetratricopeptide repeat protein [Gemmatimonadaceae bacterium]|nr:tetratricopeptide repeat protein [Gemmatimonadaceae bacterium]
MKRTPGVALILALLTGLAGVHPASAQDHGAQPKRPGLPDGADRNDPWAYYRIGLASVQKDPDKAADAFYWAARLNPVWAEPFYGRRVALLLSNPRRLMRYFRGDKGEIRSKESLAIDSLYRHALTLNPFLGPQMDHMIIESLIQEISSSASGSGRSSELAWEMEKAVSNGPPEWRASVAYGQGRYYEALSLYGEALAHAKMKAGILAERGRLFYQVGLHDSSLVSLTQALAEMRKADKNDLVFLYQSKALMEERIGMIEHVKGDKAAAREAFGRALQEDLSYYPAHVQLAYLALEGGDTATVMNEMDLAVQIDPDDAGVRYQYGYALGSLNKLKEAEVQLKKAIELDPDFAAPHFVLADVFQAQTRKAEALKEFRSFLSLASLRDPRRDEATELAGILSASQ